MLKPVVMESPMATYFGRTPGTKTLPTTEAAAASEDVATIV
jgi:hypothetical protein